MVEGKRRNRNRNMGYKIDWYKYAKDASNHDYFFSLYY